MRFFFGHCTLTGHMEHLLNPIYTCNLGQSPETGTGASLLISLAAAIVYKQLLLLPGPPLWRSSTACRSPFLLLSQQKLPPRSSCLSPSKHWGCLHNTEAAGSRRSDGEFHCEISAIGFALRSHVRLMGCGNKSLNTLRVI